MSVASSAGSRDSVRAGQTASALFIMMSWRRALCMWCWCGPWCWSASCAWVWNVLSVSLGQRLVPYSAYVALGHQGLCSLCAGPPPRVPFCCVLGDATKQLRTSYRGRVPPGFLCVALCLWGLLPYTHPFLLFSVYLNGSVCSGILCVEVNPGVLWSHSVSIRAAVTVLGEC